MKVNKKLSFLLLIIIILLIIFMGISILQNKNFFSNNDNYIFNNINEMKSGDLKVGDIVETKGYYTKNDNGAAKYEIMTYDQFYETLPNDIKAVSYRNDRWGLGNPVWEKTPVDEYGNHTLDNGLVAKLLVEDIITPEQWGAIGDGITNNTEQLIHLFAHTKSGYVKFKEDAIYLMESRPLNRKGIDIQNGIINDEVTNADTYSNNEYIWLMCGVFIAGANHGKPVMANIDGVILDGNNCTIKIADDDFAIGTNDFGVFEFGKSINNLEIKNFNFDGNGLSQKEKSTRTTNHTLVYMPGGYKDGIVGGEKVKLTDLGINLEEIKSRKNKFSNVKIYNNNFKNNGTGADTSDGGGDFILIINPDISDNVEITDNYFEDWGRWVFSVDLGGNGEQFTNYKFNNNKCIQTENNKLDSGRYRGLGLVDFEARKCWKNLEIKNNYVEGINGIAINGSGKVSEDINISGNTIIRPKRSYKSAYPYNFEFYGVQMKDLVFEDNDIKSDGGINFGYTLNNITIKNNKLTVPIQLKGLYGDIIIDSNEKSDKGALIQLLGLKVPDYLDDSEELYCNFNFTNNIGGIEGARGQEAMFFDPNEPGKYSYINLNISNNEATFFNMSAWDANNFTFDPNQVINNSAFSVRGAVFTKPSYSKEVNNLVVGGGIYNQGDIVTESADKSVRIDSGYYREINSGNNTILKCSKSGYLPNGGEFLLCKADKEFIPNLEVNKNDYVYNEGKLYIACSDGRLGQSLSHSSGSVLCGEVIMLYLTELAEIN